MRRSLKMPWKSWKICCNDRFPICSEPFFVKSDIPTENQCVLYHLIDWITARGKIIQDFFLCEKIIQDFLSRGKISQDFSFTGKNQPGFFFHGGKSARIFFYGKNRPGFFFHGKNRPGFPFMGKSSRISFYGKKSSRICFSWEKSNHKSFLKIIKRMRSKHFLITSLSLCHWTPPTNFTVWAGSVSGALPAMKSLFFHPFTGRTQVLNWVSNF